MHIPTLDDISLDNKRVLLRLDLNSDIVKGKLIPSERLTAPLKTIRELQKHNCRIVIIAHQGRPGSEDFKSLKRQAHYLQKHLKLSFVQDLLGKKAQETILLMKPKEVLLLENVRFEPSEVNYNPKKPNKLVDTLAPFFDIYINDAFSASHRVHASIVGFPKRIPSAVGRTFESELQAAQKLKVDHALLVLGGVKPDDYLDLIKKTDGPILPTGFLGLLYLQAQGYKLGAEEKKIKHLKKIIPFIKKQSARFISPIDVAIEKNKKRAEISLEELPNDNYAYDLGKETIKKYSEEIKKAKTIFFKGLPGLCNTPEFTLGTKTLLEEVAHSKAFSVISGGHTLTLIEKLKIPQRKFGYVSLSGGALVHYLANNSLPGLDALKN